MKLVVISPQGFEPREHVMVVELFAAGLERYHVRKPEWTDHVLRNFVRIIPEKWRSRLVLHQQHELAGELGCGGVHFKDPDVELARRAGCLTSRSCHSLEVLQRSLGRYDSVFFSPVFPSISKPGYEPTTRMDAIAEVLARRGAAERKTAVVALGGITPANAPRCAELGFDGVAVLGALWQSADPVKLFDQLRKSISPHAA